ncbi:MAG TPA: stage II sporulation protein D [Candidatus Scybalousia intestinigallinarum]|nr:stage II sporulation protein D [Candidatus Scybalousia intestinigallinarum]
MIRVITGYEVKKDKSGEVLVLHINYDEEFSSEFFRGKRKKSTKEWVTEYIKDEKIKWDGNKIVLMVGGVALGTLLLLGNPKQHSEPNYAYVNDMIIPLTEEKVDLDSLNEETIIGEVSEETTHVDSPSVEEMSSEQSTNQQNHTTPSGNKGSSTNNGVNKPNTNQNSNSATNSNASNNNSTSNKPSSSASSESTETVTPPVVPQEQQVTVYRSNGSVITLSMSDYLIGVVGAEMPASFPLEALKAQAVVARTYALKRISSGQKLTDTVSTQAYKDNNQLRREWQRNFDTYYNKIKLAVTSTDNMTIKYNGAYIDAVYHSTSNGRTEDAIHVWGNSVPYLKSVESSWDRNASSYLRTEEKELSVLLTLLGIDLSDESSIEIISRNASGRVSSVRIGNKNYSGVELRNLLGLRSADFDLEVQNNKVIITTRGYGHGVGMSQYGAKGMAENGYNYQQILRHYYQGISLSTI